MAHKIGLALIALLGMSNCEIYSQSNHYVLGSAPPLVAFAGKAKHNEDDSHSHGVTLGEHHVELGILNFVGGQGHHQDSDDDHHHGDSSNKQRSFSGKKKRNTSVGSKKEVSVDRKKKDASIDRKKKCSVDKCKKDSPAKKSVSIDRKKVSVEKKKVSVEKKKVSVDRRRSSPGGRRQSSVDKKRQSPRKQSSVDRSRSNSRGKAPVPVPVFKNLRYVDNDKHGQLEKAPITIVTAPLVSTAEIEGHKVGTNKVKGKSNCPQCLEQNHQAKETKKSASKSIQRYDDLLKTKIEAPIKNVEVHEEEESSDDSSRRRVDGYKGAKINKQRLNKQLVNGNKNQHRKFVVGSVVIPHQSNESEEQDSGHHGHQNHGHSYHNDHEHHHDHH